MISVVIPYFQRHPNVLRKALASIAAQQDCGAVSVFIVDDASPEPAAGELAAVPLPNWLTVRIISQANGGPGAARNTGLEAVDPGTRYVAFLDSDDEWSPDHLARAVAALDQGYDFYFADHFQLGQSVGAFVRGRRINPEEHPLLPAAGMALHAYRGDMFDQILRGNVIGTSTVVYRFERFSKERFQIEFTTAGEDYLFWMSIVTQKARIAFSSRIEATYGKGVNVYAGSGWGTDQFAMRLHNELKFKKLVRKLFPLTSEQDALVRYAIVELRKAFAQDILHRAMHRKPKHAELLRRHLREDPGSFAYLPLALARSLLRRA